MREKPEVNISGSRERWMSAAHLGSIRAAVLAVLAMSLMPVEPAQAQFVWWPQYRSWWGDHAPVRHRHRNRLQPPQLTKKDQAQPAPKGPLQVVVSIADQRISVYDDGALLARSSVSTGIPGHPTPLGVFSVIGKQRWHRSNIYSAAPMPYMQRITWSGIALHAGVLPGHPASHGCIRLSNDFAVRLWHLTKRGTRVIIAPEDTRPVEIASPHLFAANGQAASAQPATMADHAFVTAAAVRPSTPNAEVQQVTDLQSSDASPPAAAPRKIVPISVFVSRKLSKLFVRQGFTPLFDAPVGIRDPEQPMGTHVFTVMDAKDDGAAPRWTVVSMPEKSPRAPQAPKRRTRGKPTVEPAPAFSSPDKAAAALARIDIPQDVAERVSELLTPGSSLILSDYGISDETGKDTDFIVVMP
jgi:hypothetical protein